MHRFMKKPGLRKHMLKAQIFEALAAISVFKIHCCDWLDVRLIYILSSKSIPLGRLIRSYLC